MIKFNITINHRILFVFIFLVSLSIIAQPIELMNPDNDFKNTPLVKEIYTADPSAHIFGDRIYIYASHDIETGSVEDDTGNHFNMMDYRVISMNKDGSDLKVHPVGLSVDDVKWAKSRFWAPDASYKNGTYYLYFPAKDKDEIFRIGVATSKNPAGPFKARSKPMKGSYSIDPTTFVDDDGSAYMYFGGIWGGQLQQWESGEFDPQGSLTDLGVASNPAIMPRMAKLKDNMLEFKLDKNVLSVKKHDDPDTLKLELHGFKSTRL